MCEVLKLHYCACAATVLFKQSYSTPSQNAFQIADAKIINYENWSRFGSYLSYGNRL